MNGYDLVVEVNQLVDNRMTGLTEVRAEALGLDRRAGHQLFLAEDGVFVHRNRRGSLDYYGGFEYVDPENTHVVGDYVFYSCEDTRVDDALEFYHNDEYEDA
jgi:hypothetical protein